MLEPGTIILEKYRVERVLGKGGMGMVVAVRHVQLDELFAFKTMLPHAVQSAEATERFLREARACARLKGEHVARVHDVGNLDNGNPYMLMEYLEGEDLGCIIERRGALPLDEAVGYVHQACEAVFEAHGLGIVHRDLKPSNLFLTRRPNGSPCIKILDFGISKALDSDKEAVKLTKTGQFLGSPMYMSPEQMTDVKNTDIRSDIWSLGVILYELATGIAPFVAETVPSVVTKVILSQPAVPSRVRPDLPPALDVVVMRCLEKLPEGRYLSVFELMAALQPFVTVASTTLERSGTYPRAVIPSRPELMETALDLPIVLPAQVAATLPGTMMVAPMPVVGAITELAPQQIVAPEKRIVSSLQDQAIVAVTSPIVEISSEENRAGFQGTPVVAVAERVLPAIPPAQTKSKMDRLRWVAMGALVLGLGAFFTIRSFFGNTGRTGVDFIARRGFSTTTVGVISPGKTARHATRCFTDIDRAINDACANRYEAAHIRFGKNGIAHEYFDIARLDNQEKEPGSRL